MGNWVECQISDEDGLEVNDAIFEKAKEALEHLIISPDPRVYLIFKRWCPEGSTEPRYGFMTGCWVTTKGVLDFIDRDKRTPFDAVIVRGDGYVYDELIRRLY